MCTVSWCRTPERFHFLFNRDELRSRKTAVPPARHSTAIYPVDPVGGGTWILVNRHGFFSALLNNYDAGTAPDTLPRVSRGQMVLSLKQHSSLSETASLLNQHDLEAYAPFHLLSGNSETLHHWAWDGKNLSDHPLHSMDRPFSTSSEKPEEVLTHRKHRYTEITTAENPTPAELRNYHYDQIPGDEWRSPRVLRSDVRTVSFSEIEISAREILFRYDDFQNPVLETRMDRI